MADMIPRAAALDVINTWGRQKSEIVRMELFHRDLDAIPVVDAVPVVRCQDCKYGEPDTNGCGEDMVMCENTNNPIGYENWLMPPEFYCADGERREDE